MAAPKDWQQTLSERALRTLEANLVETERGLFLAAGGNQFRTLWVRDFCFSVPGLLTAGWQDLVERQLLLILSFLEYGQLPRGLDVTNPKWRVVRATVGRFLPLPSGRSYKGPLRAERLGEHGTIAFDSNLLFLRAWAQLVAAGGNWGPVAGKVAELLQPYTSFVASGRLRQPPFSDWQDSARREGAVLHSHLLLWEVLAELDDVHLLPAVFSKYREVASHFLQERYEDSEGFFRELDDGKQYALDSHLLLLRSRWLDPALPGGGRPALYRNLRSSLLWGQLPGRPVFPEYDPAQVAWTVRLVGLRHYHDRFVWGWLAAEAALTALDYEDPAEAARILQVLATAGGVASPLAEIYESRRGSWVPVRRPLYRSECPFTWTAAKCLEALARLGAN